MNHGDRTVAFIARHGRSPRDVMGGLVGHVRCVAITSLDDRVRHDATATRGDEASTHVRRGPTVRIEGMLSVTVGSVEIVTSVTVARGVVGGHGGLGRHLRTPSAAVVPVSVSVGVASGEDSPNVSLQGGDIPVSSGGTISPPKGVATSETVVVYVTRFRSGVEVSDSALVISSSLVIFGGVVSGDSLGVSVLSSKGNRKGGGVTHRSPPAVHAISVTPGTTRTSSGERFRVLVLNGHVATKNTTSPSRV